MKKIILVYLIIIVSGFINSVKAQVYEDIIITNKGDTIRGIIIEQIPDKSIKIQINSGSTFEYKMSEINKITKEKKKQLKIGDEYQGGIIFYIDDDGQHGLIAAPKDQACKVKWGKSSNVGAESAFDGMENTKKIIKYFSSYNGGNYVKKIAAYYCSCLTIDNYSDWYLPAIDELWKLYEKRERMPNLNYSKDGDYCSSTEFRRADSYNIHFRERTGKVKFYYKKFVRQYCVRCIRKF